MKILITVMFVFFLAGCLTVPVNNIEYVDECSVSSDRKTLKIVNLNEQKTGYYYSISGTVLSPILIPTSAIISGAYVLVNNIYHLGEQIIKCGKTEKSE